MLELRQARGLVGASQQQLADAAGVNVNVVSDIEQKRNKKPAHEIVVRVVRGLRKLGVVGMSADLIEEFYVPDATADGASEPVAVNS